MKELIAIQKELKAPKGQMNKFGNYKYRIVKIYWRRLSLYWLNIMLFF